MPFDVFNATRDFPIQKAISQDQRQRRVGRASPRTWRDFPPRGMIFSPLFPPPPAPGGRPSLFDRDEARDMTNRAGKRKKWQKALRRVAGDKSSRRYEAIYGDTVTRSLSPLPFSFCFPFRPGRFTARTFSLSFVPPNKMVNGWTDIYQELPITAMRERWRISPIYLDSARRVPERATN